ncbi:J domain-containing protein [Photobacterium piscicola]|uniref:J domain-containing protein n=1 Tax=Photobacterium piscicola TaxID=1378299 RepID=UPI002E1848EC|nr:J domain-containing protein [Photobacterium piscicola]MEC6881228.1 J domain-containing protein [Photobacterium piscicola]
MTTFHELLGTDDSCSTTEIKKKYRQLSNRLHPDKGGSQALMQMLSMAYQQVIKGNGNKKCSDAILEQAEKNDQGNDCKNKIAELVKEKEKLQDLLEQHKQNVEHAFAAGENSARQTLLLLQAANNSLNKQLVFLRRQLDEGENKNSISKKSNKKYCFVMLFILFVVTGGFFHYQRQHQQPLSQAPDLVPVPIATQLATVDYADSINNVARIMMMHTTGLWQQRYYEGTRQPYIAVRSINGSYIVKDCQGTFSYYSNRTHNTAHVPVNLIFSTNDRQFSVYRIPYGNGSSEQQWLNSKSLVINDNIFSNNGYQSSALALASVCSNTTPF